MILTIFCPQSKVGAGKTLSGTFGLGATDYTNSFPSLNWTDGNQAYGVHQTPVSNTIAGAVQAAAQGLLNLAPYVPAWPVGDVVAAQDAVETANYVLSLDPDNPPTITAGELIIALDVDARQLAAACGLTLSP